MGHRSCLLTTKALLATLPPTHHLASLPLSPAAAQPHGGYVSGHSQARHAEPPPYPCGEWLGFLSALPPSTCPGTAVRCRAGTCQESLRGCLRAMILAQTGACFHPTLSVCDDALRRTFPATALTAVLSVCTDRRRQGRERAAPRTAKGEAGCPRRLLGKPKDPAGCGKRDDQAVRHSRAPHAPHEGCWLWPELGKAHAALGGWENRPVGTGGKRPLLHCVRASTLRNRTCGFQGSSTPFTGGAQASSSTLPQPFLDPPG